MIIVIKRNVSQFIAQTTNRMHSDNLNFVFRKGMILPKWEDGFFPEMEDLPLWEVPTLALSKRVCRTDWLGS